MKRISVVFAIVALLPLFTNGFHTKEIFLKSSTSYKIPDKQIICVKNKVSGIIANDRNIQEWLKDVTNTITTLYKGLKRCEGMSNPEQSTCHLRLESAALSELGRLVNLVTKEMVDTFDKITDTVVECLLTMENSPLSTKSNHFNSGFSALDFQITNEQIKCLANVFTYFLEHNRDMQWWFEDIGKTLLSLIAEGTDCATYAGSERTMCIIKLKINVSIEVQRLAEVLPKDKESVVMTLRGFIDGCFM